MNISYNWLKEYITLNVPAEKVSEILTAIGLESGGVEEILSVKGGLEGLVVGKVLTCAVHENSDHLHVTTVDVGEKEALQIVCGAPNVAQGQKVIVAPIGTKLHSGDETFTIKRTKIRGVESFGMICAEDEIGVGTSHDGIIVLPDDVSVGTSAKDYYNVRSDYAIEVDITPNRIDGASHYGAARDLSAYFSLRDGSVRLSRPSVENFSTDNTGLTIPVFLENPQACPRYSAVTIANVHVGESPDWLKNYLKTIGLRPINNVVDITNFVLFETGQALHAFDADRIDGGEVHVRNLPEGTPFVTLDGVERKLSADDLMICGKTEALCIGGVFGGLKSGVTENTKNVFLESACFNPVGIRKTARRHGLNTDASFRFERGVDPDNTVYTLKRAALLIKDVAGGEIASEIIDHYPNPVKPFDVELSLKKTYKVIGKEIGKETVETILKALEIEITDEKDGVYQLKVPPYRVDVQRDVDVIEDILRIYGYNSIELSERVKSTLTYNEKPNCHKIQHLISEQLTAQGFNEIMNNSLTKSTYYEPLASFPVENCARIMNPLSSDLNVMRQTLLFGGLESIVRNINRKRSDLKFYEFGNCYYFNSGNKTENNHLAAYSEDYHLGIWLTGNKFTQSWIKADEKTSVFELKAYVENIFRRLGFNLRQFVSGEYADDLLSEALNYYTRSGKQLAVFGVVHPAILKQSDIEQPVFFADLNLSNILSEIDNRDVRFREISKYPEVRRDLSLLIDKETTFAQIEHIARQSERNLLKKVTLFDVYEGKNLEPGKKSYAVNFVLEDETKTLNDKQIDTIMHKIQTNLEKQLNAKLR